MATLSASGLPENLLPANLSAQRMFQQQSSPTNGAPAGAVLGGGSAGGGGLASQNWSPTQMGSLLDLLLGNVQTGTQNINQLNANPGANPLFQQQINPILQAMQPFLQGQQQTLQDQQRANGNLGDTSSGIEMGKLLGQQATQMGGVAANQFNQAYSQLLNGLQAPSALAGNAVRSLPMYNQSYFNPNVGQGQQGNGSIPASQTDTGSFLGGTSSFNAQNDPFFKSLQDQAGLTGLNQPRQGQPGQGQPPPGQGQPPPQPQGPSIWDIIQGQGGGGGLGGQGTTSGFNYDPGTGTFSNLASNYAQTHSFGANGQVQPYNPNQYNQPTFPADWAGKYGIDQYGNQIDVSGMGY